MRNMRMILAAIAAVFISFESLAWARPRHGKKGQTLTFGEAARLIIRYDRTHEPWHYYDQPGKNRVFSIFDRRLTGDSKVDRRRWRGLLKDSGEYELAPKTVSMKVRRAGKIVVLTAEISSHQVELTGGVKRGGVYEWAIIGHDGIIERYEIQGPGDKCRPFWVEGWPPKNPLAGMRQLGRFVSRFLTDSFLARAAKCR